MAEWINVKDRLPTEDDMLISSVLIYTEDGGVAEAGYDIKNNRFLQYRWSVPNPKVLYWMPLPKPPKFQSKKTAKSTIER